jgi:hypothetical protein
VHGWDQPMMFGGFENALPIEVRREQRSYVELACVTAACQNELKPRIKASQVRRDASRFNLRCCGQTSFLVD